MRLWEHEVLEDPVGSAGTIEGVLACSTARPRRLWRVRRAKLVDAGTDLEEWELVELRGLAPARTRLRKRTTAKWNESPAAEAVVAKSGTGARRAAGARQ